MAGRDGFEGRDPTLLSVLFSAPFYLITHFHHFRAILPCPLHNDGLKFLKP